MGGHCVADCQRHSPSHHARVHTTHAIELLDPGTQAMDVPVLTTGPTGATGLCHVWTFCAMTCPESDALPPDWGCGWEWDGAKAEDCRSLPNLPPEQPGLREPPGSKALWEGQITKRKIKSVGKESEVETPRAQCWEGGQRSKAAQLCLSKSSRKPRSEPGDLGQGFLSAPHPWHPNIWLQ